MKIKIMRQDNPFSSGYFESFDYDGPTDISVAGMLDHLNYNDDIVNDRGEKTTRITWECSCLQGVCGACAMVINNSGNFPNENRISCDRDTISVMLRCAPHKIYTELMDTAIKIMSEKIQNTVVNALEKTDDFRTIAEEYD